jgi:iron complex outermembrane receptor protein
VMDVNGATLAPIYGDLKQRRFTAEPIDINLRIYNVTGHATLGDWSLVSSTTYQTVDGRSRGDGTLTYGALLGGLFAIPNLGVKVNQETRTERISQELRGDTTLFDGRLDLQLGLYYTHESDANRIPSFDPFLTTTGAPVALPSIVVASIISRYTETSFFANGTWHFSPRFDVIGGVRLSVDDQAYYQDYAGLIVGAHRINVGAESGRIVTYQISPRFKITPDMMVYGRIATGYRPGGPNAVPPPSVIVAPDTFAPDKLTSYEVGYKASFLDRSVVLDAALFYTDWRDIQVQTSAGGFNYFVNGGSARSQGGEVTVRWAPARGLNLGLNGAYTDARLTAPAVAAGGADGDRLPFVPKWSGSLTADYQWRLGGNLDAFVGGSVNYTGERISNFSGKAPHQVPSYTTVNLRAGVTYDTWTLSIYGKNIGDERGIVSLASETLVVSANPFAASVIQPRVVGAELSVKF